MKKHILETLCLSLVICAAPLMAQWRTSVSVTCPSGKVIPAGTEISDPNGGVEALCRTMSSSGGSTSGMNGASLGLQLGALLANFINETAANADARAQQKRQIEEELKHQREEAEKRRREEEARKREEMFQRLKAKLMLNGLPQLALLDVHGASKLQLMLGGTSTAVPDSGGGLKLMLGNAPVATQPAVATAKPDASCAGSYGIPGLPGVYLRDCEQPSLSFTNSSWTPQQLAQAAQKLDGNVRELVEKSAIEAAEKDPALANQQFQQADNDYHKAIDAQAAAAQQMSLAELRAENERIALKVFNEKIDPATATPAQKDVLEQLTAATRTDEQAAAAARQQFDALTQQVDIKRGLTTTTLAGSSPNAAVVGLHPSQLPDLPGATNAAASSNTSTSTSQGYGIPGLAGVYTEGARPDSNTPQLGSGRDESRSPTYGSGGIGIPGLAGVNIGGSRGGSGAPAAGNASTVPTATVSGSGAREASGTAPNGNPLGLMMGDPTRREETPVSAASSAPGTAVADALASSPARKQLQSAADASNVAIGPGISDEQVKSIAGVPFDQGGSMAVPNVGSAVSPIPAAGRSATDNCVGTLDGSVSMTCATTDVVDPRRVRGDTADTPARPSVQGLHSPAAIPEPGEPQRAALIGSGTTRSEISTRSPARLFAIERLEFRGEFHILTSDGRKLLGQNAAQVPIDNKSKLVTGKDANVRLVLPDNTIFTIGPDSEIVLDEFVYDADGNVQKAVLQLTQGVLRWVTAKAHAANGELKVTVPAGDLGPRGTDFSVEVRPDRSGEVTLYVGELLIREARSGFKFLLEAGQKVTFDAEGFFSRPVAAAH